MNTITPEQLTTLKELALSLRQQIERGEEISPSQQRTFTTVVFALPDLVDNIEHLRASRDDLQNAIVGVLAAVATVQSGDCVSVDVLRPLAGILEPNG